jgi:hypothetical protein
VRSITGLVGHGATTIWLHRHSFNRNFGCELLGVCLGKRVDFRIADRRTGVLTVNRIHFGNCVGGEIRESKPLILVPRGVTVTQRPLEALFLVRIQAG